VWSSLHVDPDLGPALVRRLREEGHEVELRTAFEPADIAVEADGQYVVILDAASLGAALPWTLQHLRNRSDRALLVVLGGQDAVDCRIQAYQSGADEYLAAAPLAPPCGTAHRPL
jgi:DNA-binding response OmpR family regulator